MAKLLKLRRGTTTQHGSFTGAEGEVTIDTDKEVPVVHDGSTAGGHPVAAEDMANVSSANIVGRLSAGSIAHASLAADAVDGDNIADDAVGAEHIEDLAGDVVFKGTTSNCDMLWDTSRDSLVFKDNAYIELGTGTDLQIYHNGSNNKIKTTNGSISFETASESMLDIHPNGAVELYYDAVKKLETSSTGILVSGTSSRIQSSGEVNLAIGSTDAGGAAIYLDGDSNGDWSGGDYSWIRHTTGGDMEICADNPSSDGHIYLKVADGNENAVVALANGAVELYHDNIKTCETHSNGITVQGPEGGSAQIALNADEGDDNADKWLINAADGSDLTIQNYSTGSWQNELTLTNAGNLTALGNITAYSDARLKTDIKTIDNALDKVTKLRGVSYKRLDTQEAGIGVIAQEIENVLPEVVEDGSYKSVAYGNVVGVLIEAIKELKAELDEHKKKCPATGGE
tara:strand:+ start:15849 stop:17216 length:1368 start_codon:yes stop_codon:yes gene_type:complete